jgi:hypothetical protein
MKKIICLVPVIFMVLVAIVSGQDFPTNEYLELRRQNQGLNASMLENRYARPSDYYLKNFEKGIDFKKVHFLDSVKSKLKLTPDEMALLNQNLFFVTERLSYSNIGQAFHTVYNYDLPVFVSTDAILFALHMSYDKILKTLERNIMSSNLEEYLKTLYDNFALSLNKYKTDPALAHGLADADMFITIAWSLITDKLQQGHVADQAAVSSLWNAIRSEKLVSMPLFTYPERIRNLDFSQFTVRGHYVYTEQDKWMGLKSLEPYFRTMMWLGRIDFLLTPPPENPWEKPWSDLEIQRMQMGAFIVNELAMQSAKKALFDFNEQVIDYLVGKSDNLTPSKFRDILISLGISSAVQLNDTSVCSKLKKTLGSDPELGQKILSDFFLMDPGSDQPGILPISYRLSGQRFIIDSYILGSVVFDKVVYNKQKVMRMMPKPIDALFALGNNDVLPLLKEEFEKYPYAGQMANLRYLVDAKPTAFWSESLYNVWLNSIRELNPPIAGTSQPLFMKSSAWHQEKMNTQLASWSHLRHDNLLYAKQSYTGGTGCSFPYSYVEPYPGFYGRLKQFAADAGAFFSQLPPSKAEINDIIKFFPRFGTVMEKLELLAEKELKSIPFTKEENEWLKTMLFINAGSGVPPYSGWYNDLFFDTWDSSKGDYTVVDVHTQPTDEWGNVVGKVLHTGVGRVNIGVFVADCPFDRNALMAFTGPVMSYHETITDNFKRMTDQEWAILAEANQPPARPDWTNIYLAGAKGELRAKGAELPSLMYTGITEIPDSQSGLVVYPNPVSDLLTISFKVDKATDGNISLFNSNGVRIKEVSHKQFVNGRNSVQISFNGIPGGIYMLRLSLENRQPEVVKIVKK